MFHSCDSLQQLFYCRHKHLQQPLFGSDECFALQTRLPGELALELEGIATEYEADLMYYQQETLDSDRCV